MEKDFSRPNGCNEGLLGDRQFTLRPLTSDDIPQIKELCVDCFPIDYPDSWFKYISSGKVSYYIIALCYKKLLYS